MVCKDKVTHHSYEAETSHSNSICPENDLVHILWCAISQLHVGRWNVRLVQVEEDDEREGLNNRFSSKCEVFCPSKLGRWLGNNFVVEEEFVEKNEHDSYRANYSED